MNKHKHYLNKQVIIYDITDAHLQVQRRNIMMLIKLDFACNLAKYSLHIPKWSVYRPRMTCVVSLPTSLAHPFILPDVYNLTAL